MNIHEIGREITKAIETAKEAVIDVNTLVSFLVAELKFELGSPQRKQGPGRKARITSMHKNR